MPEAAKARWEVRAGVIPGQPDSRLLGRTWTYTSSDHQEDQRMLTQEREKGLDVTRPGAPMTKFQRMKEEAVFYWNEMNDPRINNWAELTFVWY